MCIDVTAQVSLQQDSKVLQNINSHQHTGGAAGAAGAVACTAAAAATAAGEALEFIFPAD